MLLLPFLLFLLGIECEAIEGAGPEPGIAIEPFHRRLHPFGLQFARHRASRFAAHDEAGIAQHIDVLHHRRQRHVERRRQIADARPLQIVEPRQQRPPRRIRQSGKHAIQGLLPTLYHSV
jgi:hypothetical protein